MKQKVRIISGIIIAAIWLVLSAVAWFKPAGEISTSERRPLAQFPELSVNTVLEGQFATKFEEYTLDQFPMRDTFRQLKSIVHYYGLLQKDNNDIYVYDSTAAKMEYPLSEKWVNNSIDKFDKIYNKYLKNTDCNVYMSIIPDKSYYIAEETGHLSLDYEKLYSMVGDIKWAKHIDIRDRLLIESYYGTDTHWQQDWLMTVAETLCGAMGSSTYNIDEVYPEIVTENFYGVYYGQAALPIRPDTMMVIHTDATNNATVFDYETNKTLTVYNEMALFGDGDMYDYFLHGAKAMLRIDNPDAKTDKELVIFRDSFGSSITPLLMRDYKTVYMVDIRYIASDWIGNFVTFDNQDVLFLYSTTVLNNSSTFK